MRKIEFKAKVRNHNEWVYGSLVHITEIYKGEEDTQDCDIYQIVNYDGVAFYINPETIGQYTGLKDKNGKKIFEGDIVLYKDWTYEDGESDSYINKGVIEYNESNCCFNITGRNTVDIADVLYEDNEDLEIIGNIWDNLELLKEEP